GAAITLASSVSAAVLLRWAGIPVRVGYADRGAQIFLTGAWPWPGRRGGVHKSELYSTLLTHLGSPAPLHSAPSVVCRDTRASFRIVLAPGASIALREWPFFDELARGLQAALPGVRL